MSNSNNNNGRNRIMNPNARDAMNKFKMEAANDLGVPPPSKMVLGQHRRLRELHHRIF